MKTPRPTTPSDPDPQRIAKVMARAGLCSRREAEAWIAEGRVSVNGRVLDSPAVTVNPGDVVLVDGLPLPERDRTRLWLFHKPRGLVTTTRDPEGRPTVFEALPEDMPRVMTVGRLDINTEGLLLLTNDGGLARVLELPSTGWLRRYRVRAHGDIDQARLDALRDGIAVDGIYYGAIEATLDRRQGDNVWITMGLREGKNREIKNVMMHLGLDVNRLIRVSFGPFQLGDLAEGAVREVPRRHLKDQLGETLAAAAGADLAVREGERNPHMPDPAERRSAPRGRPSPAPRGDERPRRQGRLAVPRPVADEPEAERPRGQKSRREIIEERRAGRPRREPAVERKARAAPETAGQDERDRRRSGPVLPKRRPEGSIRDAAGSRAERSGERRPQLRERAEGAEAAGRGHLRSRGSKSHPGGDAGKPGRARGSRTAEASAAARPLEGHRGKPRHDAEGEPGRGGGRDPRAHAGRSRAQNDTRSGRGEGPRGDRRDRPAMEQDARAPGGRAPKRGEPAGGGHPEPGRPPRKGPPGSGRPPRDDGPGGSRSARSTTGGGNRSREDRPGGGRASDRTAGAGATGGRGTGAKDKGPGGGRPGGKGPGGGRPGGKGPGSDRPGGKGPGGGRPGGRGPGGGKGPGGGGADRRR
jgi:23S rRNA pseudouridine2605 synthase